ncbi:MULTISPECIES: hypothetical protein [Sphingobium]|uniref:Uncharacterized protein n=1 Tax=Sphingobium cupriresistens TaxID=1132417 RepID=A0A8G2DYP2_9SPHN|nr:MULTISPECIES: hypothetical protein [Sphingobium]MBJ7376562.1 hypothetical protein [Sphingobium sp.]RYM12963.1 hypothetical protein EWH12_06515 [Sphingobium cupriresistens]WCP12976.1 hypothetical protein sphantq_01391 [Sphingobium sp. AntQ-1]
MLNLDSIKTQAVADQTRQAFAALDNALVDAAQLTTAFLTASQGSGLTASESQRILKQIHDSATKIIEGRSDMVRATALLTRCVERSQHEVTAFGCPIGLELEQRETARHLTLVA